ncbi:MAG TPA: histidine phosphatase family protein, partial [Thermoanaerobaculia bacterium]|nr:histidine phosphatase family protein [Thermoanaerobaculia bacterium]
TRLYSSPLERAMTTARAIAGATGLPIHVLDELKEMSYGGWEGRSFLEVRRDEQEAFRRWIDDPDSPCPGGESHNDVRRRIERAFAAMREQTNGQPSRVVAVMHGTAIRIAATILLNVPVLAARHLAQDNASISVFDWRGERYVMKVWNDTTHCEGSEGA